MKNIGFLARAAALAVLSSFSPSSAFAQEDVNALFPLSGFYGETRYRYEYVDQNGIAEEARASTLQAKFGYKTGSYYGFSAGAEFELVGEMGADDYNSTLNGKTTFPVVADPEGTELNHLWLAYSGIPDTKVVFGRQPINLDNQRFIGTVGWRQNDQAFDAAAIINTSLPDTELMYAYVWDVNTILRADLGVDTHLIHAANKTLSWLNVTGYGYLHEVEASPSVSTDTYGIRLTGDVPVSDGWTFYYTAEGAKQTDYANNTASFDEYYYHLVPGLKGMGFTVQVGYESLEGDGTNAFQTPLATLHAHNGWADKFLTTPVNGLEDLYGRVTYKISNFNEWADGTVFEVAYHDFEAENGGADYGAEWDLQLSKSFKGPEFTDGVSVAVKYADYDADSFATDTQKFWLVFSAKF